MPYSTRSRAVTTSSKDEPGPSSSSSSSRGNSNKSKRNKLVEEEQNIDTNASPPPGDQGKRKVARAVRKMNKNDETRNDSMSDFKAPPAKGSKKVPAAASSKAKGGRSKQKVLPTKQPTLLDSSMDLDESDGDVFLPLSPPPPVARNVRSSSRQRKKADQDSSRDSNVSVASTRSTRGGGGAGRGKKPDQDLSRDSNVSVASTRSTRGGRGRPKKNKVEEILILSSDDEDERELAGAALAAAAKKKKAVVKDDSTSTAKGRGRKKEVKKKVEEEEEAVMPPPPSKPTRHLRDRSKVNNSNSSANNVSSASSTSTTTTTDKDKSTSNNSGKENATPSKNGNMMVSLRTAKQEIIEVNADVFASQCRTHAKLVLQANAKLVPFLDPALMQEMKSIQEEVKSLARETRQAKKTAAAAVSSAAVAVAAVVEEKQVAAAAVAAAPVDVDTEDEDMFKEAEENEKEEAAVPSSTSTAVPVPGNNQQQSKLNSVAVPKESAATAPSKLPKRNSRKRCRSPEVIEIETKKIGTDIVTFDFQAAADKMKQSQKIPITNKMCVVEATKEETSQKAAPSTPEPAATAAPAALNATFDLSSPEIKAPPPPPPPTAPISLDATFVKPVPVSDPSKSQVATTTSATGTTDSDAIPAATRKSARNSAKSGQSEDPSEYFDAIQSPAVQRILAVKQDAEDAESSASLFESSLLPATPSPALKPNPKAVVPNKEANETVCLTTPVYLPRSALQPPSAALRLGPWLPSAPLATGLDALIEEDSQDSVKSGTEGKKATIVVNKDLPAETIPLRTERSREATSSSSSSSSGSSFKSARSLVPQSAPSNAKPIKSNLPSKEMFNFTKKNAMEREKEAQRKKDELIQQKKDIQHQKNEEWAKRKEKIRQEELKKREEMEKKLQREEADRKLQDEANKNKSKPPVPSILTKPPKAQEKHVYKPLAASKLVFGSHHLSAGSKAPAAEAQGGSCSNLGFKASGPMSGFKSASSEQKLAYQSKIKTVMGQSTPKYGAQSSSLLSLKPTAKVACETSDGFKVPEVPHSNYNYSFLDTTHESSYVSSYEITRYEDLDDDMTHREDKHVPEWALNKQDLTCALFRQSLLGQFPTVRTPFPKPDKAFKLFP